jgi:hypothetical protein
VNGLCVAVQPIENRLVAAHTSTTNTSRVWFSDAGTPEVFGANNYVDLHPNDGETIQAMLAWGNLLFVFKQSKFFVFYGNSTNAAGDPIFNYRAIESGVGVVAYDAAAAAEDGVYFLSARGLYRTTGGPPQRVSEVLDPLFSQQYGAPITFNPTGATLTERPAALLGQMSGTIGGPVVVAGTRILFTLRLWVGDNGGTVTNVFPVYYRDTGQWSIWTSALVSGSFSLRPFAVQAEDDNAFEQPQVLWAGSGDDKIYRSSPGATTDSGSAIASHYRAGLYTVGNQPSQEAVIRESVLDGTGTPTFGVSKDYAAVPTTGGGAKASVTLGTSPAYGNGRHRVAQKGRRFSYEVSATSGAWQVNQISHHVRGIRPPGVKST